MFNRKIVLELKDWRNSAKRKPLILRGARQVGKTTAMALFAQDFDQTIELNLDLVEDRRIFAPERSFEDTVAAIFFHKNATMEKLSNTLLFIDEIQNSAEAVALLRYFYEKKNDLRVVAAGSLLETLIDTHINFPVGRVQYRFMYPLSFIEYLDAMGEQEAIAQISTVPIEHFTHEKLLKLFHQYTLIGGMPEAIQHYAEHRDLVALNSIYQDLMTGYFDDVEKYAHSDKQAAVIRHAIAQAPLEAGKRIKFHGFGRSNYGSKEMGEALKAIEKAMLIRLCYPTTSMTPPIVADYKKSPRLQFLDTGLINYVAGLQKYYFQMDDLSGFYQGRLAEHIVGQELLALNVSGLSQLSFWIREKKQSTAEVDFVMPYEKYIIPIEIKSGQTGTLKSLHQFIDRTNHGFAVRLYSGKFSLEKSDTPGGKPYTLLNLPYYLTSQLPKYIDKYFDAGRL